uniref:Uncharacterized protein n=1 Tax=Anopheles coluzzii TaxID=1518534 RepID=A0A8W7P1A1_ANOCL
MEGPVLAELAGTSAAKVKVVQILWVLLEEPAGKMRNATSQPTTGKRKVDVESTISKPASWQAPATSKTKRELGQENRWSNKFHFTFDPQMSIKAAANGSERAGLAIVIVSTVLMSMPRSEKRISTLFSMWLYPWPPNEVCNKIPKLASHERAFSFRRTVPTYQTMLRVYIVRHQHALRVTLLDQTDNLLDALLVRLHIELQVRPELGKLQQILVLEQRPIEMGHYTLGRTATGLQIQPNDLVRCLPLPARMERYATPNHTLYLRRRLYRVPLEVTDRPTAANFPDKSTLYRLIQPVHLHAKQQLLRVQVRHLLHTHRVRCRILHHVNVVSRASNHMHVRFPRHIVHQLQITTQSMRCVLYDCATTKLLVRHHILRYGFVRIEVFEVDIVPATVRVLPHVPHILQRNALAHVLLDRVRWGRVHLVEVERKVLMRKGVPELLRIDRATHCSMSMIGFGLFGFATNTLNTWNASNCMLRDVSFSMFIISFRLSGLEMYFVITVKLCRSSSSSPSSFRLWRRVT